ncbi:MAG TPA: hypothetical protein VHZ73_10650 [Vicinamibacterales bacterium]|nr:hypothetical protein [Vicinamibacterales bacterium]
MRVTRQNVGVFLIGLSVAYSALALTKRFHPMWLRMRAHGGAERLIATALGSLSLKGVVLILGAVLTFWPEKKS